MPIKQIRPPICAKILFYRNVYHIKFAQMVPDMVSSPLVFQRKILEGARELQNAREPEAMP